ncbi:methylated-DNA--[protein]-cysteine S-methyltransferase [Dissulfurispira sp.]|uniref:methylated-DNA--[protein]-cysteine S-methyltransferase n=1 Tax=Dissulfurispira sp. TaxID=2817609 RepID=UPI002FDA3AC5
MERKPFVYKSPIGDIYCLFEGVFLIEVHIEGSNQLKEGSRIQGFKEARRQLDHLDPRPLESLLKNELDAYFNDHLNEFKQKIKFITGTDFEHKVWLALKEIPYGETRSYKWISEKVGRPKAMRAVGQALKKNPMPIILPCHRVIASDGSIGGFSCGVEIKGWLLRHEGAYGKRGMSIQ